MWTKALTLTIFALFSLNTALAAKKNFGAKITLTKSIPLHTALENHTKFSGKDILISAKVEKVCEKKGCWMGIGDKNNKVRVTFKDYGFFVPTSLVGKEVKVQGKLLAKTMDVKEARHYAMDAGKSKAEIAKITKPVKEYRVIASGIEVSKD